jgi:hypothetical protein
MLDMLWCVDLDHVAEHREGDGPDRPELVVLLLQELVELLATDGGHERHVAEERDGALWLLDFSTAASANSVGTVLEDVEGYKGGKQLEAVFPSGVEEDMAVEGSEGGDDSGHDG